MKGITWLLCFGCSSYMAILVNKYVLWKMKFTYPTIFQSWQMCFASFLLFSSHILGYMPSKALNRTVMLSWFPATVLFSLIIYSGSVSLARLPVPMFAVVQQAVLQNMSLLLKMHINKTNPFLKSELILYLLFLLNGTFLFGTLSTFNQNIFGSKLKWMVVHCFASCGYSYFAMRHHYLELKEYDKLLINSLTSIILLLTVGIVTGETTIVFDFPYLYNQQFMTACMCSGIFGAVVMISYCNLCYEYCLYRVRCFNTIIMFLVSLFSLLVDKSDELTAELLFMILLTFCSTCYTSYFIQTIAEVATHTDPALNKELTTTKIQMM